MNRMVRATNRHRLGRDQTGLHGPGFLGLGAQRAGTSWIYSCLAEHPHICIPEKEVHFFSRGRQWDKGYEWYESLFAGCPPNSVGGEFSSSYLSSSNAAERIFRRYPQVRLVVSLRNPVDRAFSNYMNDVMRGAVDGQTSFPRALQDHPEYLRRGRYRRLLKPFMRLFDREQILILVYEDIANDPGCVINRILSHLGLQAFEEPSMLHRKVNVSRQPRSVAVERLTISLASRLRRMRLDRVWWTAKKLGLGDAIRRINTRRPIASQHSTASGAWDRAALCEEFQEDIDFVSRLLSRDLHEWRL